MDSSSITQILHIAQKNSVAKEIAIHLSNGTSRAGTSLSKYNPVFEFPMPEDRKVTVKVTSVRGHVFEYYFPEEYKMWNRCSPRLLLREARIMKNPSPDMTDVVKNIETLARTSQKLVLWLDCDREGEAIAFQVIELCRRVRTNLVIRRARFSAVTRTDVLRAWNNLTNPNQDEAQAVQYRRQIDFRIGCCFTRYQTLAFQQNFPSDQSKGPITYGPCQFPTLGFVVERYLKVQNFQPEKFWVIKCTYVGNDGKKLQFRWKRGRIFDEVCANALLLNIYDSFPDEEVEAHVENQAKSIKKKFKPYPLATITLQKLGTQKLRMSSDQVMDHAEKLYQKGILSYPRTETDSYPPTMNLRNLVAMFENAEGQFGQYARKLLRQNKFMEPRKGKKNDNAHPPIHPVKSATIQDMTADQWRVYDLICRHFLGSCSQDAEGEQIVTDLLVSEESFSTTHLKVLDRNYLQIFTFDKWTDTDTPPDLPLQFRPLLELEESVTTPPTYLTETELITLMDKNQIGTDSTIHEHIKTILTREFAIKTNQTIKPAKLGLALIETYKQMQVEFSKCDIRREIEQTMNAIAQHKVNRQTAVDRTIAKFLPIFDRLQEQRIRWVQLMRKYLPNNSLQNNMNAGDMGMCGECSSLLSFNLQSCSVRCDECNIDLLVPYGNITLTDVTCPICNFPCYSIENQAGKRQARNICPKCYNQPDQQWMVDITSPHLQCSKCKYNCKFAKGLTNQGLFQCPSCASNKTSIRGTNRRFIGCLGWPTCKWIRTPKNWIKNITPLGVWCPICQEERNIESTLCQLSFEEEVVAGECMDVFCKLVEAMDTSDIEKRRKILTFCMHPQCSPYLYEPESMHNWNQASNSNPAHQNSRSNLQAPSADTQNSNSRTCYNCGQPGHFANTCKKPKQGFNNQNQNQNQAKTAYCYFCKKPGHLTKNCGSAGQATITNAQVQRSNSANSSVTCYKCLKPGHFASSCPGNNVKAPNQPIGKASNQQTGKAKKACKVCGHAGRHPKNSNCLGMRKKKGGKGETNQQEDFD